VLFRPIGTGEAEQEEVCADHLGLLMDPDADPSVRQRSGDALSGLLLTSRQALVLSDLGGGEPVIPEWIGRFQSAGMHVSRSAGADCPYLPLAATWDEQFNRFSANFRSQYRRGFRAWQETDDPAVEWHDQTGTLDQFWGDLVRLHQGRWKDRGKPGVFSSARFCAFHREVLSCFHRRGWLLAGSLRSGGRTLAANYSFQMGDVVFHYQSGVETGGTAKFSPGFLLHAEVIRRGITEGKKEYDLLRGSDEYKQRFTDLSRTLVNLEVSRPSLRRAVSRRKDSIKDRLRPFYRKVVRR